MFFRVKFVGEQITQGEGEADEDMAKCMKKKRFFGSLLLEKSFFNVEHVFIQSFRYEIYYFIFLKLIFKKHFEKKKPLQK